MNNNLTLSVTLSGDGRQLSGTLKDAQGEVREFTATTERESKKAESALEKPGRQAGTVSEHLRGAQREARTFGAETDQGGRQATQALTQTGDQAKTVSGHLTKMRSIALGAATALVGMAGGFSLRRVISETADFEDSILGLQAVSGATVGQINQLEQQARSLGATSMHSAKQSADAQRFLAQAGFDVNEVLAATPSVLSLATAGQMDLAQAADIASNVLGGMRLEVDQLNRVNNVMAATSARSNTNIMQLGEAFSYAGPFAASAGISIETTSAAIGVLSDAGLQASRAGTGLIGIIRQLSNVTPQASGVLADYGLTVEDVNIEAHGLETVLERIRDANMSTADAFAIFGSEAGAAAQILAAGAGRVREFSGELNSVEGEVDRMAQIIGSGLTGSIRGFNSMLSESVLQLGESGVSGAFGLVVDNATGVLAVYNDMLPALAEANDLTDDQIARIEALAGGIDLLGDALIITGGIMAGRYVGAVGTVTVAKLAATQQTIAYQLALARMAGVSTTVAAGQLALAGSARAAAGAMALVGGPAGAAVLAVGALYYYREELGLVDATAQNTKRALEEYAQAIGSGNAAALDANYDNLVNALEGVSLQAQDAMSQLTELTARQKFYENSNLGVAGSVAEAISEEEEALASLWAEQVRIQTAMRKNREERDALNSSTRQSITEFRTLDQWLFKTTKTTGESTEADTKSASAKRDQAAATAAFASQLEQLQNRLVKNRREVVQLAKDQNTLNLAFAMGRIGVSDYLNTMGLLQTEFIEAQNKTDDLADKTVKAAFTMEGAFDELRLNGLRRLDDGFADLWLGAVDGSRNASDTIKRVWDQTLAELLHMAITRPITVQLAASMGFGGTGAQAASTGSGGGFGISPMSFGGASQAFGNAFRAFQGTGSTYASTFGSELAVQTQGGLKAGFDSFAASGFGNAALGIGGGLAGSFASGAVFGKSKEQQIGSTVGGVAGQVLIPIPGVGAAIGSFIGGGLGSLVAHSPTEFKGRIETRDTQFDASGMSRDQRVNSMRAAGDNWSYYGGFYSQSAFGDIGFGHEGSQRLHRADGGPMDDSNLHERAAWGWELSERAAELDNYVASLARSAEQVDVMRNAVQSLSMRSGDAAEIIQFALVDRSLAALDAAGITVSDRFRSLSADAFVAELQAAVGAFNTLSGASNRLNLQFDATASGALNVADTIAQAVGGAPNLAPLLNQFYESFYTEQEKFDHLAQDLTQAFAGMGLELPQTRAGLRDMVEGMELMGAAGQQQLATILQLNQPLAQYITQMEDQRAAAVDAGVAVDGNAESMRSLADIARERERLERQKLTLEGNTLELRRRDLEALDESNRPLQQHIWTLQDEADAAKAAERALADMSREAERAASALMGGVQNAYKALTQSISNEQAILRSAYDETTQRINANISTIQDAISASERTARSLTSTLDTMMQRELGQAESRREAQSYLQSVLASGGLGDPAMLDKALTAVAEPSEGLYGSFEAYQRDFWTTANVIDQLNDRADGQLTTEQRSLAALERQLATAERQFNSEMGRLDNLLAAETAQLEAIFGQQAWLQTINGSVLSLSDALAALGASTRTAAPRSNAQVKEAAGHIASTTTGSWDDKDSAIGWAAINAGVTSAQLAASIGKSQQYVLDRAQQLGLPKFRDGGIASGPDSGYPVELHGTEAIIPLKNGPIPLHITGGGDAELLREIRRLNDRIARLEVELKEGNNISRGIADHTSKAAREAERQRHERQQEVLA